MRFYLGALAGGSSALLVALLVHKLSALRRIWVTRRRSQRALAGEKHAVAVLRSHGYQIVAEQQVTDWEIIVDGRAQSVRLRADLIVRRGGQSYVAEVKTGDQAPRLSNASTRRQLLEYYLAYGVDGVLLVEPEIGAVYQVEFPAAACSESRIGGRVTLLSLAAFSVLVTALSLLLSSQ